jgi:hypothetical protein
MNATTMVHRDERTVAVENASYRWSYLFLSFGILALVAFRSLMHSEAPWDLLLLVVLGGGVGTAYQASHRVFTKNWWVAAVAAVLIAIVLAAVTIWMRG